MTEDERMMVEHERFYHADPNVRRRMETVWLKSHDLPHAQIARLNNISENTVRTHIELYLEEGLEGLLQVDRYRPQKELNEHAAELKAYFERHPPQTATEAQAVIEHQTGIHRGLTQVRAFLHQLGMDFRKVGAVPSKGDAEVQEDFKKKSYCHDLKKPKPVGETSISWMRRILSFGRS